MRGGKLLEPPFSAYALSLINNALWYIRTYRVFQQKLPVFVGKDHINLTDSERGLQYLFHE